MRPSLIDQFLTGRFLSRIPNTKMGRPREFDEDEVLERALHTFWRPGYEATSVTDLMQATGLAKGSLYVVDGGISEV